MTQKDWKLETAEICLTALLLVSPLTYISVRRLLLLLFLDFQSCLHYFSHKKIQIRRNGLGFICCSVMLADLLSIAQRFDKIHTTLELNLALISKQIGWSFSQRKLECFSQKSWRKSLKLRFEFWLWKWS